MSITGHNALTALAIALVAAFILSLYTFMWIAVDVMNAESVGILLILERIWGLFKATSLYAAPVVFLLSFALLQRFRIKY